jgi:hypothetical protein
MFLAIDECLSGNKKILGGLLTRTDRVSWIEKDFTDLRIEHKLFGEVKWNHISQYVDRYCDFIDLFFNDSDSTYHSICYTQSKYKAAYSLIRSITWKLEKIGINEPIYVLFDNDGNLGSIETKKIKELADKDGRFKCVVEFCNQGVSHVLGVLQLADLLTGCISVEVNNLPLNPYQTIFFEHVKNKNGGNLTFYSPNLPKLDEHKIHFLDPDQGLIKLSTTNSGINFDAEIKIPMEATQKQLMELNSLLKSSTGSNNLVIVLPTGKRMPLSYGVNYNQKLFKKIEEIFQS